MSEETRGAYKPQVGDTVRSEHWSDTRDLTVTAVGESTFLARFTSEGPEQQFPIAAASGWVKVEPTPADRWHVYRADEFLTSYRTKEAALENYPPCRVARFSFAGWED